MQIIQGKKIIWDKDDFLKGLSEQYQTAVANTGIMPGFTTMSNVNPFFRLGSITSSYKDVTINGGSSVTAVQKSGKVYREGFIATTYGNQLVRTNLTSAITTPALTVGAFGGATWPYAVNGGSATCIGEDTAVYDANVAGTSTNTFFYSWRDNASWNVGLYNGVAAAAPNDDFMSTVPTNFAAFAARSTVNTSLPHPMEVGDDDVLYIGDGRFVHAYDGGEGTNGTYYDAVLTLGAGYVITSFARITDYLVVFAHKPNYVAGDDTYLQGTAKAFFYDMLNNDPTYIFDLNDNFVGEAVTYNGTVACFTRGRTNDLEFNTRDCSLQVFTGSIFESVADWFGTTPVRGGCFVNGKAIWFNAKDRLGNCATYAWGQVFKTTDNGFYQLHNAGGTGNPGCLAQPSTYYLYGSGGTNFAFYLNPNQFTSGSFTLQAAAPAFPDGQVGKFTYLKINFSRTTTTAVPQLAVRVFNQDGDQITLQAATALQITDANLSIQYNAEDFDPMIFNGIYPYITWAENATDTDCQTIQSIEVGFDPVNISDLQ
jgi:hypothetical protein